MRLLIGGSSTFFFHLKEFSDTLNKLGVESKLVFDADYSDGFPSRKIRNWFQTRKKFTKLIDEFKPDAIFIDRQRHFGIDALKANIPLFVLLRGHYWSEINWNKKTMYKSLPKRIALSQWDKLGKEIFNDATAILPICKYLEKITNKFVPDKPTSVFFEGIDASKWWVGDGPLRDRMLSELDSYGNFHWLGKLQYPDKVREYLSEIDVYALITGMDLAPLSLKEAQLMKKPVVATNVGGVPEMMIDGKTGFLVEQGNYNQIIDKLSLLFGDKELAKKMGNEGRKFVEETFNWERVTKNFIKATESYLK